jgi:hypothetical protein
MLDSFAAFFVPSASTALSTKKIEIESDDDDGVEIEETTGLHICLHFHD